MLQLKGLGEVTVAYNGEVAIRRLTAPAKVLFYLGASKRPIRQTSLAEVLWSHLPVSSQPHAVRQAIYIARKSIEADVIRVEEGYVSLGCECALDWVEYVRRLGSSQRDFVVRPDITTFLPGADADPSPAFQHWVDGIRSKVETAELRRAKIEITNLSVSMQWGQLVERFNQLRRLACHDDELVKLFVVSLLMQSKVGRARRELEKLRRHISDETVRDINRQIRILRSRRQKVSLSTPLTGRDAELRQLRQRVVDARESKNAQIIAISGGPGMGKTRCLVELGRYAAISGSRVTNLDLSTLPLAERFPAVVTALTGKAAPGRDLAEARFSSHAGETANQVGRLNFLFEQSLQALEAAVGLSSVAILVDGVERADATILRWLKLSVTRLSKKKLLVACATTSASLARDIAYNGEAAGGQALHVCLPALNDAASRSLAIRMFPGAGGSDIDEIVRRANGIPGCIVEEYYSERSGTSPLRAEFARVYMNLSEAARKCLHLLAIAEVGIDLSTLGTALDLPTNRAASAIEELVDYQLVRWTDYPELASPGYRTFVTAHAAAGALEKSRLMLLASSAEGRSREFAAHMYVRAGLPDRAVQALTEAAHQSLRSSALEEACDYLRRAASLTNRSSVRARASIKAANVMIAMRQHRAAIEVLERLSNGQTLSSRWEDHRRIALIRASYDASREAIEAVKAIIDRANARNDNRLEALALIVLAMQTALGGTAVTAGDAIARIAAASDSTRFRLPQRAELKMSAANLLCTEGDFVTASEFATQSLTLANSLRNVRLQVQAKVTLGTIALVSGNIRLAESLMREVTDFRNHAETADIWHMHAVNFGIVLTEIGDTAEAIALLNAEIDRDTTAPIPLHEAMLRLNLSIAFFEAGDRTSAKRTARECCERLKQSYGHNEWAAAAAVAGLCCLEDGDVSSAKQYSDSERSLRYFGDHSYGSILASRLFQHYHDPAAAEAVLIAAIDESARSYVPGTYRLRFELLRARHGRGQSPRAEMEALGREAELCGMSSISTRCASHLAPFHSL